LWSSELKQQLFCSLDKKKNYKFFIKTFFF
jgi:hypothetical protein